ncbi:hypothetical protein [Streptomyces sp. Je 1-369]|uniref:hypothetical protein n=1 Tax=Streptomyces sp. Je 1-369 TaxID=2966192 RepID=UPI002286A1B5|nr:hypothetical protein [Streptomyces sp. Je 1-369]WAL93388.1 hypothetical protein NOO62_02145 [Streptomyces sp. Je 1-369]
MTSWGVEHEEAGLSPGVTDPFMYWYFRFWQTGPGVPYDARDLAYACAAGGLRAELFPVERDQC